MTRKKRKLKPIAETRILRRSLLIKGKKEFFSSENFDLGTTTYGVRC